MARHEPGAEPPEPINVEVSPGGLAGAGHAISAIEATLDVTLDGGIAVIQEIVETKFALADSAGSASCR